MFYVSGKLKEKKVLQFYCSNFSLLNTAVVLLVWFVEVIFKGTKKVGIWNFRNIFLGYWTYMWWIFFLVFALIDNKILDKVNIRNQENLFTIFFLKKVKRIIVPKRTNFANWIQTQTDYIY